jgi:hypothetical protein
VKSQLEFEKLTLLCGSQVRWMVVVVTGYWPER